MPTCQQCENILSAIEARGGTCNECLTKRSEPPRFAELSNWSRVELAATLDTLLTMIEDVTDAWEEGDLAGAVNELTAYAGELCTNPERESMHDAIERVIKTMGPYAPGDEEKYRKELWLHAISSGVEIK